MELRLQDVESIGNLRVFSTNVIQLGHADSELFEFLLHRANLVEDRDAFDEDRPSAKRETILRKITRRNSLRAHDAAVIERFDSGKHFQQRGFSRPISADHANAVVGCDQPIKIFEQQFVAEALSSARELNHKRQQAIGQ